MARTREILKRKRAVENIRTVTGAMEMVASSRFHRAHKRALASRPHCDHVTALVEDLATGGNLVPLDHPLLANIEDVRRDVLLVITSSRGLCGSYNNAVLRVAMRRYEQISEAGYDVLLNVVGKRGVNYLKARGYAIHQTHAEMGDEPSYQQVGQLAEYLMAQFTAGLIGGLEVVYVQYQSAGLQRPVVAQVLPLGGGTPGGEDDQSDAPAGNAYEFDPSPREVIRHLLPASVRLRLYQCFLDASVSEQISRMRAMRAAVDNADDMIHDLTIRYNRLRQGQITTELAEIMGGRMGREG